LGVILIGKFTIKRRKIMLGDQYIKLEERDSNPVNKERLILLRLEAFKHNPDYLLTFLREVERQVSRDCDVLNPAWNKIDDVDYAENCVVTGSDHCHKAVMITQASEVQELVFSDLHNNFQSLSGMLGPILAHLNQGGVVLANGDNLGAINQNSPKGSLDVLLVLFMLMQEYPKQFFYLLGNHEMMEIEKSQSDRKEQRQVCSVWESFSELERGGLSFGTRKEPIFQAFYRVLAELPEIAMSKVTRAVYVHASLPEVQAGGNQLLVNILESSSVKAYGAFDNSRHTLDDPGFNLRLFQATYRENFGFEQARLAHAHQCGYGCKILGDRFDWVEVTDRSVMTTYSSSQSQPGVDHVAYFDKDGFHPVPDCCEGSILYSSVELYRLERGLLREKIDVLPENPLKQCLQRTLHEVDLVENTLGLEDHQERMKLIEVLRRTHVILSDPTPENIAAYRFFAGQMFGKPFLLGRIMGGTLMILGSLVLAAGGLALGQQSFGNQTLAKLEEDWWPGALVTAAGAGMIAGSADCLYWSRATGVSKAMMNAASTMVPRADGQRQPSDTAPLLEVRLTS
jgi:hypothetical protein